MIIGNLTVTHSIALAQLESAQKGFSPPGFSSAGKELRPILEQPPHSGFDFLKIHGLRKVGVKAGGLGAVDVFWHAETGQADGGRWCADELQMENADRGMRV